MLRRFSIFLFCLAILPFGAEAKIAADRYVEPDLASLTKFTARFGTFKLTDTDTFKEYLKITDCKLASNFQDSPFKMQEIQQSVLKSLGTAQDNKPLYFRLPVTFQVSGYNFNTQSLPIVAESQFKRVNVLDLTSVRTVLCTKESTWDFTQLSGYYVVKLNIPISLYRIPIQRNIAESFFNKLNQANPDTNERTIYGYMLVEVDTIQPEIVPFNIGTKVVVRGQLNAINLYLDQDYRIPFKTLDFSENN